jgi:hypothetical protein
MTDLVIKTVPYFPGNTGCITRKIPNKTLSDFMRETLGQGDLGVRYLDRIVSIEVQ